MYSRLFNLEHTKPSTYMKSILCLALSIAIISCGSSSETSTLDDPGENPQWISFQGDKGPGSDRQVVLVSGDEEYRSEEVLPQLARILSERHGFKTTVLFAQRPDMPGLIDPNHTSNIPGLSALEDADLMILFTRFRDLPDDQMRHIENYLMAGKPVMALRTATHAFQYGDDSNSPFKHWSNSYKDETSPWNGGFGRLVLGEKWYTHHGHHKNQSTRGLIAAGAENSPLTRGIKDGSIWGPTDVYGVRLPMPDGVTPIVMGQVIDRTSAFDESDPFYGLKESDKKVATVNDAARTPYNPNDPMMPIAWTKPYELPRGSEGMAFTSTIGSSTDFSNEGVRRLLVNAVFHMSGLTVPQFVDVGLVGEYNPSPYAFQDDQHWIDLNLRVSDFLVK